ARRCGPRHELRGPVPGFGSSLGCCMKATIVVVEDDYIIGQDLKESLEELGFRVHEVVADAAGAIRAATHHRPDLVVMDIMLQGQRNGILAARHIGRKLAIPVLFLTAYADDGTVEMAKQAEPAGYLVKPYHPRELNASIHVALHRARTQPPRATPGFTDCPTSPPRAPITVCAWCNRVRLTDRNWQPWSDFLRDSLGVVCSHGMCPACLEEVSPELADEAD
ncbi:MAG: response regulator, partial [Myxococcota bacterium]